MEETIKFHFKPNEPITDWNNTILTTKMEAIGKLIANECIKEHSKMGGSEYKFTISDIYLKESNKKLGTVEIKWTL